MSDVVLDHPHGRLYYWFIASLSGILGIAFTFQAIGVDGSIGWVRPVSAAIAAVCALAFWQAIERLFHSGRAFARSVAIPDATRWKLGLISKTALLICIAAWLSSACLTWFGSRAQKDVGQDVRMVASAIWLLAFYLDDLAGTRR
jgi:hypothetical protein